MKDLMLQNDHRKEVSGVDSRNRSKDYPDRNVGGDRDYFSSFWHLVAAIGAGTLAASLLEWLGLWAEVASWLK